MLYTVLTSSKSSGIAGGLTYECDQVIVPGSSVRVPLRNKLVSGIVMEEMHRKESEDFDVKRIHSMLGDAPLLHGFQIQLLRWMAEYYCCSVRQAAAVFLPSQDWNQLLPSKVPGYALAANAKDSVRGEKQMRVVECLLGKDWVSEPNLREEAGAGLTTIRTLLEKGILVREDRAESFESGESCVIRRTVLTDEQRIVADSIHATKKPSLLFGITGSGKTEVYAELIADAIEEGKQAILLVPEILLTEHILGRFHDVIGAERIAVVHSKLTESQRRLLWKRIRNGGIDLVIGSRSALFSPLEKLGLVILDEEHEWTYKNEQTPRYHARETAEELCKISDSRLVLGSATPSLESWSRTKDGRYHLVRLPNRFKNQPLPDVRIVDLASVNFGSLYPFSPPLLEAIEKRLARREQTVLFLNRRGLATALLCLDCRRRIVSPDSQLPFTVHRSAEGGSVLVDHTTNLKLPVPEACPHCHSLRLLTIGAGTQRIEQILHSVFPSAKILRADRDSLSHPDDMKELLRSMREREADILFGTQSVVKGLDLPEVTLAAVVLADVGLSLPHFRAGERIFQLLTQLTGRSGRAKPGEVIIQTYRPDAQEVRLAAEHRTEDFLDAEWKLRLHAGYPPASNMIRLLFRGDSARSHATDAHRKLQAACEANDMDIRISSAPTFFGGGKIWHVLLRGTNPKALLRTVDCDGAIIDIDPMDCI